MSQSRNLGNVGDGIVRFADGTTQSTAASGFPSVNPTYISANTTAAINTYYVATSNLTLTLPSSPASGSTIGFSNQSNTRICVINNNGSNINGFNEKLTVDVLGISFYLVYTNTSKGWILV